MKVIDKLYVTRIEPAHIVNGCTVEVQGQHGPVVVPMHLDWEVELGTMRKHNRCTGADVCTVRCTLAHTDGYYLKLGDSVGVVFEFPDPVIPDKVSA